MISKKLELSKLGIIIYIIVFPIQLSITALIALLNCLYYQKCLDYNTLILSKNNKEFIAIQLPLQNAEEQKNLEDYFKKYLNTDITKLPRLWFIPGKKI